MEAALWAAVRALEDRKLMLERMARQFDAQNQPVSARSMRRRTGEATRQAQATREAVASAPLTSLSEITEGHEADLDELDDREEGLAS